MSQQLLWVDGARAQQQGCIQTARERQTLIRSHAQRHRIAPVMGHVHGSCLAGGQSAALARSLRPNRSLGRLAGKTIRDNRTSKRNNVEDFRSNRSNNGKTTHISVALPKTLQLLWHDFSASERSSLSFFQIRTSQEWSGWEDSSFWSVLALQVSQQSQTVARSLIALSALHESMEALNGVERARLRHLSHEQSARATRAMLAKSDISYLEALVSCLAMGCFHGLQHSQGSFVLLRSGLRLLLECDHSETASCEERQVVDLRIRPLFNRLLSRPATMVDMCKAFILSVERQRAIPASDTVTIPLVPQKFNTLSEARDSLEGIMNWAHDSHPHPVNDISSRHTFLTQVHELKDLWHASLASSKFQKTARVVRSQRLLEAACLAAEIIIDTAHCINETAFDEYHDEFQEIMLLLEGAWSSGHNFGIDAGHFDIAAFVGTKCRDPQIRRKALRLLQSENRLEGDRIAANPAKILEALIALEERGAQPATSHDVPERNRRRLACGQQYIVEGRIDLFYKSSNGTLKETCCVSLAGSSAIKASRKHPQRANIPDTIFGTGYAAYLEDRESMSYFRTELERFYFPIPRV